VYVIVPPGEAETPPSVLVIPKSGKAPVIGVDAVAVLFAGVGSGPFDPSLSTVAVFAICVVPVGNGFVIATV
jgi:hypothetical protein